MNLFLAHQLHRTESIREDLAMKAGYSRHFPSRRSDSPCFSAGTNLNCVIAIVILTIPGCNKFKGRKPHDRSAATTLP
jgi:hypothetical protein